MIKIAICDDEKYFVKKLSGYVSRYLEEKGIPYELDVFYSGRELIEKGIEIVKYSIIFLDINMKDVNGIVTAQNIRKYTDESYIVFVTAYIDYSLEGYKVNATRYIIKNSITLYESIHECLNTILDRMKFVIKKKIFKFNEGEKEIHINRIVYIESKLHRLEFHILEESLTVYSMYETLNKLEPEMVPLGFLRVHQSYLVNMRHIQCITANYVILTDNQNISIPKARYKHVKSAFVEYKGEM